MFRLAAVELPYKVRSPAALSSIGVFVAYLLPNDVEAATRFSRCSNRVLGSVSRSGTAPTR